MKKRSMRRTMKKALFMAITLPCALSLVAMQTDPAPVSSFGGGIPGILAIAQQNYAYIQAINARMQEALDAGADTKSMVCISLAAVNKSLESLQDNIVNMVDNAIAQNGASISAAEYATQDLINNSLVSINNSLASINSSLESMHFNTISAVNGAIEQNSASVSAVGYATQSALNDSLTSINNALALINSSLESMQLNTVNAINSASEQNSASCNNSFAVLSGAVEQNSAAVNAAGYATQLLINDSLASINNSFAALNSVLEQNGLSANAAGYATQLAINESFAALNYALENLQFNTANVINDAANSITSAVAQNGAAVSAVGSETQALIETLIFDSLVLINGSLENVQANLINLVNSAVNSSIAQNGAAVNAANDATQALLQALMYDSLASINSSFAAINNGLQNLQENMVNLVNNAMFTVVEQNNASMSVVAQQMTIDLALCLEEVIQRAEGKMNILLNASLGSLFMAVIKTQQNLELIESNLVQLMQNLNEQNDIRLRLVQQELAADICAHVDEAVAAAAFETNLFINNSLENLQVNTLNLVNAALEQNNASANANGQQLATNIYAYVGQTVDAAQSATHDALQNMQAQTDASVRAASSETQALLNSALGSLLMTAVKTQNCVENWQTKATQAGNAAQQETQSVLGQVNDSSVDLKTFSTVEDIDNANLSLVSWLKSIARYIVQN